MSPEPPASRRAYELVKARWLDGSLRDHELLSEGAVASELGISRTPVREAFLQLQAEGLLELYPKRGALVVPISDRDARELFEARRLIEQHGLDRLLAAPPAEREARLAPLLAELDELVAEQRRHLAAGEVGAYVDADRRLHRAWVAAAGNRVLLQVYDQLRDRQQRLTASFVTSRRRDPGRLVDEHEAIVAALRAGDRAATAERLERHLEGTIAVALGQV
ncbi:GntR family transcriptional regulator [Patulibacter defluvii]|uniref:GntR family transcriptional regulator n=1 Tax=Patulibacter defluvii TaxID=3095358 RepID=UPI002A759BD9|nr:GntR family transcriptional regulator [Patulibacter sp. DM4]